jgi:hypothetical protein
MEQKRREKDKERKKVTFMEHKQALMDMSMVTAKNQGEDDNIDDEVNQT